MTDHLPRPDYDQIILVDDGNEVWAARHGDLWGHLASAWWSMEFVGGLWRCTAPPAERSAKMGIAAPYRHLRDNVAEVDHVDRNMEPSSRFWYELGSSDSSAEVWTYHQLPLSDYSTHDVIRLTGDPDRDDTGLLAYDPWEDELYARWRRSGLANREVISIGELGVTVRIIGTPAGQRTQGMMEARLRDEQEHDDADRYAPWEDD